jgi:homoserine kinase type II
VDLSRANELYDAALRLAADAQFLRDELEREFLSGQITEIVTSEYDLGEVVGVEQIFGGTENLSFAAIMKTDAGEHRYFVRKYKHGTVEREIRYEHALVRHVREKGFELPARVFETKVGDTVVAREELLDGARVCRFFAIYEMLGGDNTYTWTENRCTDAEYVDAARILARFHHAAADFEPGDLYREQPPIMEYLATMPGTFNGYADGAKGTKYDRYLLSRLPVIMAAIDRGLALAPELEGLPRCATFCDYHPGNLKWSDERGVGLFDFDWTKLDYRVFDVAIGIVYFCTSWAGTDDGELRLDKAELFLQAYQDEAARTTDPGPLSDAELAVLPRMLAIAALYVVSWDIVAYYIDRDPDDDEYLFFLEHNVAFVEFIEQHLDELAAMCARASSVAVPGAQRGGEEIET